jgi:hypothetical protein
MRSGHDARGRVDRREHVTRFVRIQPYDDHVQASSILISKERMNGGHTSVGVETTFLSGHPRKAASDRTCESQAKKVDSQA